jgi:dipeptidyl aminopeptidase/acylaminoacyl peptidase/CubicO group peptidase (beta-lactamase class C family)
VTRRQRIEDLTAFAVPQQPALSPDGSRIAYVLRTSDVDADRDGRALWWVGTHSGEPERLTRGDDDSAPAWSPDGTTIAFLRAEDGPAQVWLLPVTGGEPRRLTSLPLGAGAPVWSPDGRSIAFSAPVDPHAGADEDDAARAKRAGAPLVADRLDYRADGAGHLRTRSQLHVVDVATTECRQLTSGDGDAGAPAWSPDSARLAYGATTSDTGRTFVAPAYVLAVDDPAPEAVGLPDGVCEAVTWLDDAVVVAGTTDTRVGHIGLFLLRTDGEPVHLTAALDRNVMTGGPAYPGALPRPGGDGILFCARDRGCTHLYTVGLGGGVPRPVVAGAGRVVAGLSVAGDTAAIVLATPTSYGEVVTVDLATGAEHVRTAHGDPGTELYVRQEREFTISDGTIVHGWLVRDPATTGRSPLLLDIHGGPHNAWSGAADEAHLYHQELAALGWTVLLLNPRASDGYGAAFFTATEGAWGVTDAKDVLEPVDQLVAEGVADQERLAVTGYSYGGYLTCFLTSRDDRFAAAVAGGVVSDLTSMVGTSDNGHGLSQLELAGPPWADPDHYAAMSPFTRVEHVRTPTLILHGAADLRCPVGQAEQWHAALRARGVPTRLVLYPDGSHLFFLEGPPSHRIDFNRRVVDWVERYANGRRPRIDAAHWGRRLSALAAKHHVPGATLGILRLGDGRADELVEAAHGVLNVDTGVETTTDSVFQTGSITKVWTTTIVMQLVDEGLLDLDAPVVAVLPELRLSEPTLTERLTTRHLLTHTSGIDGDVFDDTGSGDDCMAKYVALLAGVARNHPLGATWSYCNSGFVIAGRVIEKLTGMTWDQAVATRIIGPLGLTRAGTLPEEALLHRAAVGHTGVSEPVRATVWALPRAMGPAGRVHASVADVLGFARMHLTGGLAPNGARVLGAASVAAMAAHQADLPDTDALGESWGLGWSRYSWAGRQLVGHDGNTIGQSAFLRLLGEEGLAVTLLTNGGNTRDLYEELYGEIFAELADVAVPEPPRPPATPVAVDVEPHLGTYERAGVRIEVLAGADGPVLRTTETGPIAELVPDPVRDHALVPLTENHYVAKEAGARTWRPVMFYTLPTGERYLFFGVRGTPRSAP